MLPETENLYTKNSSQDFPKSAQDALKHVFTDFVKDFFCDLLSPFWRGSIGGRRGEYVPKKLENNGRW